MSSPATPTDANGRAPGIAAVVVTYNRAALLVDSVDALLAQSLPPAHVLVVDNASSDDTEQRLRGRGWLERSDFTYLRLPRNTGGAGGFNVGLAHCVEHGFEWIWLTDDDAVADRDALAALTAVGLDPRNVYGSAAVYRHGSGFRLCWPARLDGFGDTRSTRDPAELAACQASPTLPFLGFLIAAALVRRIGLPDADFFISGDDMEYVERARRAGAGSFLVRDSRLLHPRPSDYGFRFAGREFFCLALPPWRRYFYVRNKVVIARRHYGRALYTQTLPGLAVRLLATLLHESGRRRQLRAYLAGVYDGLRGRLGDAPARRDL